MTAVIFHGVRDSVESPRAGRLDHELWCVTRANATIPGNVRHWAGQLTDWSRWFDLHPAAPRGLWPGLAHARQGTLDWYALEPAGARPIYMAEPLLEVPASVRYPIERLSAAFPDSYFGCMIDYLFALAIDEGFRRIVLNGVGMSHDAGHIFVHRTILYWIGVCHGLGIAVAIEGTSCYRPGPLYGYERFGYDELDAIMAAQGREPDADPDAEPFTQLALSWRQRMKTGVECAQELDHLVAVLQRTYARH